MKSPSKKRKGGEVVLNGGRYLSSIAISRSHVSLEDYSRLRKRGKEDVARDGGRLSESRVSGVVTAPPLGSLPSGSPTRGIKRKIGCIDAATRTGRKKKIEQDYYLGAVIGKGKFGSVRMCWSKASGEVFACKTLSKGEEPVHREVEVMQHLSGHVGIVTLKAVYEDAESFYLVMEFCPGGRLLDQMARARRYSEHHAANILKELVMVIKYCHDMGVVHRDIKPENVLLTSSGRLKLADFGLAVRIVNGKWAHKLICLMMLLRVCHNKSLFCAIESSGVTSNLGSLSAGMTCASECISFGIPLRYQVQGHDSCSSVGHLK